VRKQQFSLAGLRFKEGYERPRLQTFRQEGKHGGIAFSAGHNVGMDDAEILFASTTYACLVRSEGDRICGDFNSLRRWAKKKGAFQT
jgi:hypothetical protein